MKNFKELRVWQHSIKLVSDVCRFTRNFPNEEKYGLVSQMRRSAVSIPSNIAEGHMRTTGRDFKQFLAVARGSCSELETQAVIARELGYLSNELYEQLMQRIEEVGKMLSSFYSKI